jgi:hypothetical protein
VKRMKRADREPTWTKLVCMGLVPACQRRPYALARVDYVAMWWHGAKAVKRVYLRPERQLQILSRASPPEGHLRKIIHDPGRACGFQQFVAFGGSQRQHA